MIPILYDANTTNFSTQGRGSLGEATRAEVRREINGIYSIEIEYPFNGRMFEELQTGLLILADAEQDGTPQVFEIVTIRQTANGKSVIITGEQIAQRTRFFCIPPFTAEDNGDFATAINTGIEAYNGIFVVSCDTTITGSYSSDSPVLADKLIYSALLDNYGGELDFNLFNVIHRQQLGADRGVVIRYGGSLRNYELKRTTEESYNFVCCYYNNNGVVVFGNVVSVKNTLTNYSDIIDDVDRALYIDCTEQFTDYAPSIQELTDRATEIITQNATSSKWRYGASADIDYLDLSRTANYKNVITSGDIIKLGDYVTLIITNQDRNAKFGYYEAKKRIIGYTWNCLTEQYSELEFADTPGAGLTYTDSTTGTVYDLEKRGLLSNNSNGSTLTASDILARAAEQPTETTGGGTLTEIRNTIPIIRDKEGTDIEKGRIGTNSSTLLVWAKEGGITHQLNAATQTATLDSSLPLIANYRTNTATDEVIVRSTATSYTDGGGNVKTNYNIHIVHAHFMQLDLPGQARISFNPYDSGTGFTLEVDRGTATITGRTGDGNPGNLGTTTKPWNLYGTVSNPSDERLKTDIAIIPDDTATEFIENLVPVIYKYKTDSKKEKPRPGFIAQDIQLLQKAIKNNYNIVTADNDGILSVNYTAIIPILTAEIQNLQRKIDELEKHVYKI